MSYRHLILLCGAIGIVLVGACSKKSSDPGLGEGTIEIVVMGAQGGDRAILLEVTSGATRIESARGDIQLFAHADDQSYTVAVIGPLAGSPIMRVTVADLAKIPDFTILDVAAEDGNLRTDLSVYSLQVVEP